MANRRPPRGGGQGQGGAPGQGRRPGSQRPRKPAAPRPPVDQRADDAPEEGGLERLQKVLAHAGVGSRRACEDVILQGRVTVDGKVVRELGTRVDPQHAKIAVDGQRIHPERMVYFAVSKPKGYVSTNNDPSGRPRVVDLLPEIPQRVYTVGRLDEMSTGLILLTNDGELANRLSHPKFGVEKLYRVVVAGTPEREVLTKLTEGVWLAEGKVRARRVRIVGKKGQATIMEMVLAEGKNREVRRMLAKLGHKVMTLTRIAVGPITLKGLAPGEYRPLSRTEIELLRKVAAGIAVSPARFPDRKSARGPRAAEGRREGAAPRRPGPRPAIASEPAPRGKAGDQRRPSPTPSGARAPRPQGPPPPRRPVTEGPARRSTPPTQEPRSRRIIGLDAGPQRERPPRRGLPKRRFPRASLGPRRDRPTDEPQE